MAILLYQDNETGQAAFGEEMIYGERVKSRTYQTVGHFVEVGGSDVVIEHDVQALVQLGYRLATPQEQDTYYASKRKASTVSETTKPIRKDTNGG